MNPRKKSLYVVGLLLFTTIIVAVGFPFSGGAAPDLPNAQNPASGPRDLPNYDAFGASTQRSTAIAQAKTQNQSQPQLEGGRLVQFEPRLGVPTFLWASDPGAGSSTASAVDLGVNQGIDLQSNARQHLGRYASRYRLAAEDVATAKLAAIHDTGKGVIIVKFKQEIGGVEVFRDEINVIMNRNHQLIALSGYLTGGGTTSLSATDFASTPKEALARAAQDLTGNTLAPSALTNVPRATDLGQDQYLFFTADRSGTPNFSFTEQPARVKQVMYHLLDEYIPAYYVELSVYVPSTSENILSVSGGPVLTELAYSYVISAVDGRLLFRKNLMAEIKPGKKAGQETNVLPPGGFTYRVWADPVTGFPYDTPAGNGPHPKVVASPNGAQAAFVPAQNVQLPNYPFSQNDPWLAPGAIETNGNNVDAFVNLVNAGGDNGYGPVMSPIVDPPSGDHRAITSGVDQFLYMHQPDVDAFSASARQASITQLFYNLNFLHDWFYDAGFNEAAGNAQKDNFGRGGLESDDIKAQVQDTASFSNANMFTPADGARPRMRMYNFPNLANMLHLQTPAGITSKVNIGISQTGLRDFDVSSNIVIATFTDGPTTCTITNAAALTGKIAMFDFDNTDGTGCSFSTRVSRIHATSAAAALMVYTSVSPTSVANIIGLNTGHTKGIGVISWNSGQTIKGVIGSNTVTARLLRVADRDGALDNQIVFHEWGHFISNRLIGNGGGLTNGQGGGMGEGWGDFTGMLALTVREDDTATPSNATWNGAYALATYAQSGVPFDGSANQGYYFGIRRYPYSTDLAINPLTFKHIEDGVALPAGPPVAFGQSGFSNAEVHNTGEVWANMLWECYAALLRDTQGPSPRLTFTEAQDRMKNYLVAAYKMTPITPTFVEARDAVLAAAFANDFEDGRLFSLAFAKRGLGINAVAPDRFSSDNGGVVESFADGNALTFSSATVDDSLKNCDADGYVDNGEQGLLHVTLKNSGFQNLGNTTATVSSNNPHVSFPNGTTVNFPDSQPHATTTGAIAFAVTGAVGIEVSDFTITFQDPGPPAAPPGVAHFFERLNVDEALSRTDNFESMQNVWTASFDPALLTASVYRWNKLKENGSVNHYWHVVDPSGRSDQRLTSPAVTVDSGGSLSVQFDHSWGFESGGGANFDGGVIEISVNGGAWTDIGVGGTNSYNGTIFNQGPGENPLGGRPGFVANSPGTVHTSLTQAIAPGSTVQIRFRFGSDSFTAASGWNVDNVAFAGIVETPFPALNPETEICKLTPTITWSNPADITYPTPLSGTQLNATASVPGVFTYTPPATTVLNAGNAQTLSVNFVPTDTTNYNSASKTVSINVLKATPTITWSNPADISYPTPLSGTQLNATASVPGVFTYTPPATTVLNAGNAQTLSVSFVPTDTTNYNSTSKTVSINVLKATPTITWSNPADISYPTPLSGTQLNATASVPGDFTYTPVSGTVLNAGNGHTLSVNFVPTDTINYNNVSKNVSINVLKGTPTITWNNPADITYPTPLSGTQLNATASVPGVFTYTPPATTVLDAGNAQTLSVNFVPTDTTNYNNASKNVSINVLKATPTITWSNPADITYPTPLSGTQLNATASVPGVFTYTPPATTVLDAGNAQTLSVNFVPADTTNYNSTSKNVSINVLKATPTFTWSNPADITYPTALSGTQLNATVSVPGAFTYTPPATTVLNAGNAQTLSVNFVPTDTTNYNNASKNVSINVLKGTPTITWNNPADITYPTALSGTQLNATASVPGAFTYTPPATTVLNAGNAQTLSVNFVPTESTNYNNASKAVVINVLKANQTITFGTLGPKMFGDPDFTVNATSSSGLTVTFSATGNCTVSKPAPGTVHLTGVGTCTITASQAGNIDYNAAPDIQSSFSITRAASNTAVSSSVNPSELNQSVTFTATLSGPAGTGTPTGAVQFKDGAANLGSPVALNATGLAQVTVSSLTTGNHNITADYVGDLNFLAGTGTLSGGQVIKAQPSLSIDDVSISEGNAGTKTLTFTAKLSSASSLTVTANFGTADGTATAPADYVSNSGTITFDPAETSKTLSIIISGDVSFEADETLFVNLSNATNATVSDNQGTGTIQNDDAQGGFIGFSTLSYNANENAGFVTLTVVRTNDVSQAANVDFVTDDAGALSNCNALLTGLASQRCDFTAMLGTLTFAAGETQKTIDIPINLDAYTEGPETFTVGLTNSTGGALLTLPSTATVTLNDSASPTPNAIDDTTNFVRQQYRDFLNREADPAGLAFWKDNIDKCNDPARRPADQTVAQCIEVQRILTSAAFFLSIEFKQTGGMVREFYVAALDRPATNNMPNFIEFMRDTQAIQKGVVVGQGNWQQLLDANRTAFMNEFVVRGEFVGLYPTTDTPAQYVDKLYLHANVAPVTSQERLDAILEFGGATMAADPGARGRALLRITQNANFQAREGNRTFVQIEYFGYLRRNPNDPPDSNFDGYNFWLSKLSQFNGDFLQAEMVKAFLSSGEYRDRFGP